MNAAPQIRKTPTRPPAPSFSLARPSLLQRKCAWGGTPGPSGECEECRKKRLQRKVTQPSTFNHQHSEVPPVVHEVLRSPGQPLDAATRAFMEPRFGYDFSHVRVRTDAILKNFFEGFLLHDANRMGAAIERGLENLSARNRPPF